MDLIFYIDVLAQPTPAGSFTFLSDISRKLAVQVLLMVILTLFKLIENGLAAYNRNRLAHYTESCIIKMRNNLKLVLDEQLGRIQ